MTTFGYFITRELTETERAELTAKLEAFGASLPEPGDINLPPVVTLPGLPPPVFSGWRQMGDVEILWANGVPMTAHLVENPDDAAAVPPRFWQALQSFANAAQRVPFLYLAFHESRYVEGARNLTPDEDSWGALQINLKAHPEYNVSYVATFEGNVAAAQQIYDREGYGAWWISSGLLGLRD